MDYVHAIRCQCPCILQRWALRPRYWPAPDVVRKVVSLQSFVTPEGFKGSDYKFFEWRIFFNTGETELVNNLNVNQIKLYVILKMIIRDVLNPKKKEITSYVLKNIIFWQAESNTPAMFQDRNMIHWLHDALRTLRTVISSTQLPFYMIPERNLMAACGLQEEQRRQWVAVITEMLEEGPRMILRVPKIRQAIVGHPEPMLWFSRRRMELEMLCMEMRNRATQCSDENGVCDFSDIIVQKIDKRVKEIKREVLLRMFMEGNCVHDRFGIIKRILM
ncbi:hypothetical protein DPMN_040696 [Dreissena polymorpha]|uniref:Mab-21-like HhH/H2TH-like domain-containing protein n=1 Tax=Dreissena polymorpha TaxID=45954 RepID=A0A9D4HVA7_DREPO|nr:hypothetical protein DPMN_040696 [Dreissena polymorpha]